MTAMDKYNKFKVADDEADPVERLRAFCSFAMNGQDWIDVEQFFDAVLAERDALLSTIEHERLALSLLLDRQCNEGIVLVAERDVRYGIKLLDAAIDAAKASNE
jgi:hypothetical protein